MNKLTFNLAKLVLAMVLSFSTSFASANIYLSATGDDDNDGSTPALAVATLNKAFQLVDKTNIDGETIFVSGTINVSSATAGHPENGYSFNTTGLVVIAGVEGTSPKLLGDGTCRMLLLGNNAICEVKNITISGPMEGTAEDYASTGGALLTRTGCFALLNGGSIKAENVIFKNFRTTNSGGAIQVDKLSDAYPLASFKNCVFTNNTTGDPSNANAGAGAAIRIYDFNAANGVLYVENCAFFQNRTYGSGGNSGSAITVRLGSNTPNAKITIVNSTFSENKGGNNGAIYCTSAGSANGSYNIINCTVKDNFSQYGIISGEHDNISNPIRINVFNSIVEGSKRADGTTNQQDIRNNQRAAYPGAVIFNIQNSLIGETNVSQDVYMRPDEYPRYGGGILDLFNFDTNSYAPLAESLVINFGNAQYLKDLGIDYDQLGNKREFTGNKCDVGAIETAKTTTETVSPLAAMLSVYQSGSTLFVKAELDVLKAELISLSGQVVATAFGNEISLNNINKGFYLVKIDLGGEIVTQKIFIQ